MSTAAAATFALESNKQKGEKNKTTNNTPFQSADGDAAATAKIYHYRN